MRILHVSDCYLPRLGGIEMHLRDLVVHQRDAGHDVRILTTTPTTDADPAWVRRTGVELRRAEADLARLLREETMDVVHVHLSVLSPFATLAARHCSAQGIPTLVTVHSMLSRLGPLPRIARSVLGLRRWPVVWSAVSERAAEPLRDMLGPDIPVWVAANAVDPAEWRSPSPWAASADLDEVLTIVSVMRLTRTKRTLPLARMLGKVRAALPHDVEARAVIIGDGPQRHALGRYLRRHHLDDWVALPGRLERSDIQGMLARGALFVAPATLESFGIAPLEARASGLPVVASSRSGVGEFITSGVEGLLADSDDEMVEQMLRLLTDDRLRATMAAHNRAVPPRHDWTAACRRTEELYELAAVRAGWAPLLRSA